MIGWVDEWRVDESDRMDGPGSVDESNRVGGRVAIGWVDKWQSGGWTRGIG